MSLDILLMNVWSWETLVLGMLKISLIRNHGNHLVPRENFNRHMSNNAIINNVVDEILLNETQKVSAAREAPEFFDSDCDEKNLYQVEKISLEETKGKLEWSKREFEFKQKISHRIENKNDTIHMHDREVDKIAECNLLHDIINTPKRAKILNSHYSPILDGCINTGKGIVKFNNFQIILDSGCSSRIVMGNLV